MDSMDHLRLRTVEGRAALEALLARPDKAVVALDFDGTLAPIVDDPAQARAEPAAVEALVRLAPKLDSVVVVTGRPAALAVQLGGLDAVPGLVVLGHYGRERWEAGEVTAPEVPEGIAKVREALPGLLSDQKADPGVSIEDKGGALAVHTRRAADPGEWFRTLRDPLDELAAAHGLTLEPGRFVLEIRPAGVDKGTALTEYLAERGAETVLFAGDDLGDLPAFAAVDVFRSHGGQHGLGVCSGSAEVYVLAERADLIVEGPAGVAELLESLVTALR
jgi:trehalose 6-phosphate phosphatase